MDLISNLSIGFGVAFTPINLLYCFVGCLLGTLIGVLPGIGPVATIAMLLPATYALPPISALIMMAVITNSFANVVSSFFSSKLMLHLEEMLVAPLAHTTIVLGFVVGGVVRGLLVAALVVVVALFFTNLHVVHPLITFTTILLTAIVFSLAGLFNAIFAKTFDDISIIPTFVLTPLTYLGGVFFSISLLSPFWQKVALANPIADQSASEDAAFSFTVPADAFADVDVGDGSHPDPNVSSGRGRRGP